MGRKMRKKSGNSKENNKNVRNITHSKRFIVIIPYPAPYNALFFDSQRNTNFLHGNLTTLFTLHIQCNKQIIKLQNNINVKSKQYLEFSFGSS